MNSRERKNIYLLPIKEFDTIDKFTNIKSVKKSVNIFDSNVDDYECHSDGLRWTLCVYLKLLNNHIMYSPETEHLSQCL